MAEINAELKRLREAAKKKRKREADGVLTEWCMQVAACIAVLLNFDFKAGTEWLDSRLRRGKRVNEPLDLTAAQAQIEDFVLNTPDEHLGDWTNPDGSPLPRTVLKTAVKWSEERKLRDWVRGVNVANGTPVRSEAMANRLNASLIEQELAQYVTPVRDIKRQMAKWCWRWRLKHGEKISFLRTTEPVALDDMREQASSRVTLFYVSVVGSCVPNPLPVPLCMLGVSPAFKAKSVRVIATSFQNGDELLHSRRLREFKKKQSKCVAKGGARCPKKCPDLAPSLVPNLGTKNGPHLGRKPFPN